MKRYWKNIGGIWQGEEKFVEVISYIDHLDEVNRAVMKERERVASAFARLWCELNLKP